MALYLPPDLVAQVDAYAKQSDVTRSWVFTHVVRGWLDDKRDF